MYRGALNWKQMRGQIATHKQPMYRYEVPPNLASEKNKTTKAASKRKIKKVFGGCFQTKYLKPTQARSYCI